MSSLEFSCDELSKVDLGEGLGKASRRKAGQRHPDARVESKSKDGWTEL